MAHTTTITIDTLAIFKKLKAAGFEARQAEVLTEVIRDVFKKIQETIATKPAIDS